MGANLREIFLPVKNYEGLYEVSNLGRVKSLERRVPNPKNGSTMLVREKIRKHRVNIHGYEQVVLSKNGYNKNCTVHRLVAIAFIPNPNEYPVINHKDRNKLNNTVENLEHCTQSYNILHSPSQKGKFGHLHHRSKAVIQFDNNGIEICRYGSELEASRISGVNRWSILQNISGKYKHAGGFQWKLE